MNNPYEKKLIERVLDDKVHAEIFWDNSKQWYAVYHIDGVKEPKTGRWYNSKSGWTKKKVVEAVKKVVRLYIQEYHDNVV